MPLIQSSLHLLPNPARVVVRPLQIASEPRDLNPVDNDRMRRIIAAVRAMDGRTTQAELALVLADFESRHREIRKVFEERYDQVASDMGLTGSLDRSQRQLIGAYFCHEYSFGAAAVMNPSIVPHSATLPRENICKDEVAERGSDHQRLPAGSEVRMPDKICSTSKRSPDVSIPGPQRRMIIRPSTTLLPIRGADPRPK